MSEPSVRDFFVTSLCLHEKLSITNEVVYPLTSNQIPLRESENLNWTSNQILSHLYFSWKNREYYLPSIHERG